MDKRILYAGGLLVIFVIVITFFLSQPKKSTIPLASSENLSSQNANKTTEYSNLILDKNQYNPGELITFKFKTNSNNIYICGGWVHAGWYVQGLDRGVWNRINIFPTSFCLCTNISLGSSSIKRLECQRMEPPQFVKIKESEFVWDQKVHHSTHANCDGKAYPIDISTQAPLGEYNLSFCYYYNVSEGSQCSGVGDMKYLTCTDEATFVITGRSNQAENVSDEDSMGWGADGETWVEIDPVGCLENPWEVDWLKFHNNDYTSYPLGSLTEIEPREMEVITLYYQKFDIEISEINTRRTYDIICGWCGCPEGHTMCLLVNNEDVNKMLELGYKISDVQS